MPLFNPENTYNDFIALMNDINDNPNEYQRLKENLKRIPEFFEKIYNKGVVDGYHEKEMEVVNNQMKKN